MLLGSVGTGWSELSVSREVLFQYFTDMEH